MSDPKLRTRDDIVRKEAVRWLSPSELTSAALRVGLSSAFGEYSDKREIEQIFSDKVFDYQNPVNRNELRPPVDPGSSDPLWVDYVSDTGDGFAATYAVAWMLAQKELAVEDVDGETPALPRGHLLIHGGDLVYPTATTKEYEERFTGPYASALPYTDSHHPHFFAIPGNHDWYDGLTSFIRKFCDGKWLGGRKMPQTRSYFSIRLSENWWIWGIDIQFDGFIDTPQLKYFKNASAEMSSDAGVILVTAKPSWAFVDPQDLSRPTEQMHNLDFFLKDCLNSRGTHTDPDKVPNQQKPKANVRMILAGDVHHYARYEDKKNDVKYVTAGGGGAYLSLTHHLPDTVQLRDRGKDKTWSGDKTLDLVPDSVYPTVEWSKKQRLNGLLAGWRNPSFGMMLGSIYLILAWLCLRSLPSDAGGFTETANRLADEPFWAAFKSIAAAGLTSPGNIALFLGLTAFMVKFTRSTDWAVALLAGVSHGMAHIAGLFFSLAVLSRLTPEGHPIITWLIYVVGFFIIGAVVGSVVFGTYLVLADTRGIHPNDLYAAQRIEHKKHFLRMRVTDDLIEVWAIGLDHVPTSNQWKPRQDQVFPGDVSLAQEEIDNLEVADKIRIASQQSAKALQDEQPDFELDPSEERNGQFVHKQIDYFKISRVPATQD